MKNDPPIFSFNPNETLTPEALYAELHQMSDSATPETNGSDEGVVILERGVKSKVQSTLADQFIVFQLNNALEGQTIFEASQVEPQLSGTEEAPDVNLQIQLQSFHMAESEEVDENSRVTMRMIIGKDSNSRDRMFDDVFWTISAGLNLYNSFKNRPTKPQEFKSDLSKALGNRPIEIPGGLANMTFELVLHKDREWWQNIFGFLQSQAGQQFTSVLGFPALTQNAIKFVDELFNRFEKNKAKALFKSRSMILALSEQAKLDYTAGNPRIRMGSLNPGFCIIARGRDFKTITENNAYFYPHYGLLVPADVEPQQIVGRNYDDPFANITYAVFKVGMAATRLQQQLYYGNPVA